MDQIHDESSAAPSKSPAPHTPLQSLSYAIPHDPELATDRITRGDVASLALKIIGVYVLVQALPSMVTFLDFLHTDFQHVAMTAIPFLLIAGLGAVLVAFSQKISRWLLPRTAVVAAEPPGHGPAQFQAIAFSIVGVLLVVWSAPSLAYLLVAILFGNGRSSIQFSPLSRIETSFPSIAHYGVELGLGIWLFFGSRRLSAWWWGLRHPEFKYVDAAETGMLKSSSNQE